MEDNLSQIFHSLSDPTRRNLLLILHGSEGVVVGVLSTLLGISPSLAGHHLKQLTHAGLTTQHKNGRNMLYKLNPYSLIDALVFIKEITSEDN